MIPNQIHKVLSSIEKHRVRALLMGGQACALYGAAEFSRDIDFAIVADAENLSRLRAALAELRAGRLRLNSNDCGVRDWELNEAHNPDSFMGKKLKVACKNCGEPTTFDSNAHYQRVTLGWCGPCFQQSSRSSVDKETGKKRWWDDEKVSTDWTGFNPPGRR